MRILTYKCGAHENEDWDFSEIQFRKLNLLVGDTATGKTRLLNTIFNAGRFVAADEFKSGAWEITFSEGASVYRWALEAEAGTDPSESRILKERLALVEDAGEVELVRRTPDEFLFHDDPLPKLAPNKSALSLLREEDDIRPAFEGFATIRRRRFFADALDHAGRLEPLPPDILKRFDDHPSKEELYRRDLGLNSTLFLLSRYFADLFEGIQKAFREAFPYVASLKIRDLPDVYPNAASILPLPVACIREGKSNTWVPITEMSSGMLKVLLIVTDLSAAPDGGIYIIDEYENSLGMSAINFLPDFLMGIENETQLFITSHHPYIINAIPPKDWYIFHRNGTRVTVKFGEELEDRFGKSSQKAFVQLINDPFYADGVE